ncbi:hypothetical protein GCM10009863_16600 [Streptomyces axinellae]|uniref:Uncharacterized protein n=1 Tax=Streptomyces axinellae TaxID=552788 RepID=A0ABN3PWE2_9ACTN
MPPGSLGVPVAGVAARGKELSDMASFPRAHERYAECPGLRGLLSGCAVPCRAFFSSLPLAGSGRGAAVPYDFLNRNQ